MKHVIALTAFALLCVAPLNSAEPPAAQDQETAALMRQIQAQQEIMAENQAAIEAKLATVAEAVRIARVFAGRTGIR